MSVVKRFLNSGCKVAIWDKDKNLNENIDKKYIDNYSIYQLDLTNYEEVQHTFQKTINDFQKIDILINNAGIAGPSHPTWEYPNEDWHDVINVDLNSVFYCSKIVVPHMIQNNYGRVVNIASIAGKEGNPRMVPYSATKSAVIGLTKSVGKELAGTGVLANCITPAVVQTRILDQFTPDQVKYMVDRIPVGRTGEITEIAALVAWLSSSECSFSTGAVFDISGGRATY